MLQNEEEYKLAVTRVSVIKQELDMLQSQILKYSNIHYKPVFESLDELKSFIPDAEDGTMIILEGKIYKILGWDELVDDYGWESTHDSLYSSNLSDLLNGGRLGILYKVE